MNKKLKRLCGNVIAIFALKVAQNNINSTCMFSMYQPELPQPVERLRKIDNEINSRYSNKMVSNK